MKHIARRTALAVVLTVFGALIPAQVSAQTACVAAGSILDVPTPGYLRRDTPNLVLDFERGTPVIPVSVVSHTTSRLRIQIPATGLLSDAPLKVRHIGSTGSRVVANLRSCPSGSDPTGGGGGSGGGGGEGDTTSAQSAAAQATASARAQLEPATRLDVVAPSGAPEFLLLGSANDVSRAEAVVNSFGGAVLRRRVLSSLGLGMAAVDLRGLASLNELRGELSRRGIDVGSGRHNVYSLSARDEELARTLVFGATSTACQLPRSVRVGLIDGPVNTRHPALAGVAIETATVLGRADRSATADHATGLAGLIASPGFGLAPGSNLFAVNAVSRVGARELAKLEDIAAALDWMVSRQVDVVNMSLAGPSNAALQRAIAKADDAGIILVAAVGNDRRARVAYPASDARVIAVTAVDANKKLYRRASRGAEVDFAAPGVDLRVPTANRMAFRSGTSYASAAITALIAVELSQGRNVSQAEVRRRLAARAEDLGPAGRDADFGFGLARASGC